MSVGYSDFVWPCKMVSVNVSYLFYQPMEEKIKTWTLRFPAKENPNMEKALFDWPIVLQYDVKVKYRLISRKSSGMTFFHPSVRWTDQKPPAFVSARLTNQIALFSFICCFCFVRVFSFQGHTKIENTELVSKLNVFRGKTLRFLYLERQNFFVHAVEKSHSTSPRTQASNVSTDLSTKLMWKTKRFT